MADITLNETKKRSRAADKLSRANKTALAGKLSNTPITVATKTALNTALNAVPAPAPGFYIVTSDSGYSNARTWKYWTGTQLNHLGTAIIEAIS